MEDKTKLALEATRRVRQSPAFRGLAAAEQQALARDLTRIESVLAPAPARTSDPYALGQATPADLQRDLSGPGGDGRSPAASPSSGQPPGQSPPPAQGAPSSKPGALDQYGRRTAEAIEAVNFPGFVAGLVTGTFQAIVDATAQQLREYANLVASLSKSVDDFARDNVSNDQARGWLADRHGADLRHVPPPPGKPGEAQLVVPSASEGQTPTWLEQYGLRGQELTPELANGPLLEAGRQRLAEERLQTLATMVLMGINRIVINDGDIRAKMQFHAVAREKTDAEIAMASVNQGVGIAGRQVQSSGVSMLVSTAKVNAQADASIKTNLTGEVRISFKTETFPLERFADSAAIQLINRHARWKGDDAQAAAPAAAPGTPAAPAKGPTA